MGLDDHDSREQVKDAAYIFRVKRTIDAAIADLASRPLDEATAEEMRAVLASDDLAAARKAWARLVTDPPVPVLRLVTDQEDRA